MSTASIVSVLICDDIRQENNGKFIIIGVYGTVIIANALPARLGLSVWLELENVTKGDHNFQLQVIGESNIPLASVTLGLESSEDHGYGAMPLRLPPIQFGEPGSFRLEWKSADDDRWDILRRFDIQLREPTVTIP